MSPLLCILLKCGQLGIQLRVENLELGGMVTDIYMGQLVHQYRTSSLVVPQTIRIVCPYSQPDRLALVLVEAEELGILPGKQLGEMADSIAVQGTDVDDAGVVR